MSAASTDDPDDRRGLSRRRLLTTMGLTAAGGLAVGAGSAAALTASFEHDDSTSTSTAAVPFRGQHQAGIATPAQDRLLFASYGLAEGATRADIVAMLKAWTLAADRLTQGRPG